MVFKWIGRGVGETRDGNIRNIMRPSVSGLKGQPFREAAVEPKLHPVVAGIPGGLSHCNRTQGGYSTISRNHRIGIQSQTVSAGNLKASVVLKSWIAPNCGATLTWHIRGNVIPIYMSPPDMQPVVADVRGLQDGVLH